MRQAVPVTEPSQEPGNDGLGRQERGTVSRPARQYRPGRGRHVENTITSALVRANLVPRPYLLTARARKTDRPCTNPVIPAEYFVTEADRHPAFELTPADEDRQAPR